MQKYLHTFVVVITNNALSKQVIDSVDNETSSRQVLSEYPHRVVDVPQHEVIDLNKNLVATDIRNVLYKMISSRRI